MAINLELTLKELVKRIVDIAQPEQIILFGSAARDQMSPDSDLDVLVIKDGVYHKNKLAQDIYMNLFGVELPVDVILATPSEIKEFEDCPWSIISPAMHEGKVIYNA